MTTLELVAIDPPTCACTECLTGQYRPLDQASDKEMLGMVMGLIQDNTGIDFTFRDGELSFGRLRWDISKWGREFRS